MRPSKQRGQNFLFDPFAIQTILDFANLKESETVVEVGPGLGALTQSLVKLPSFAAIELEHELSQQLLRKFPGINLVQADVREVDFTQFGSSVTIISNLPYSISTDAIFMVIAQRAVIHRAMFLMQREFAERVASPHGSRSYGILSVATQLWCDVSLGPVIDGDCFEPSTKVESRMIELRIRKSPRVEVEDFEKFMKIVRAGFAQRRRTLTNSLLSSGRFSVSQIDAVLAKLKLPPEIRAEQLSIENFACLAAALESQASV